MRRPMLALTLSIGIGLVLGACSSQPGSAGESVGGEPSVPAAQSEVAAASQPTGSDVGNGGAPALADGPWTGGQGQTTVSGAVSHTTDAPITTDVSKTEDAKTLLAYNTDDTFVTVGINFIGVPFHADVTGPEWAVLSEDCEVTYARADDNGIDATFSCVADEFYWYLAGEEPTDPVMIEGSFTATR